MTQPQVRRALGPPHAVFDHGRGWRYGGTLSIHFFSDTGPTYHVFSVATRNTDDPLPDGTRVGSTWSSVEHFSPKFCYAGPFPTYPFHYYCQWYPTLTAASFKQKPGKVNPTLCKPMILFARKNGLIAQLSLEVQEADGGCPFVVRS